MQSKIISRRDLEFLLYEWLNAEALIECSRYADHSKETFNATLDTCERIATDLFATHNKKNDEQEPYFDGKVVYLIPEVNAALEAFIDAGLMAAGHDYKFGGMQLPVLIEKAGLAYFKGAHVGTVSSPFNCVLKRTVSPCKSIEDTATRGNIMPNSFIAISA